jgi:hypothetical protein
MGPGSLSAFTRVFDALWAGTTETADTLYPRPTNGIRLAITVMNSTLVSSDRPAM